MASNEEIKKANIAETNKLLSEQINLAAALADVMNDVVKATKNKGELDKASLDFARQSVKLAQNVASEYDSMAAVEKDIAKSKKIQNDITKQIGSLEKNIEGVAKKNLENFQKQKATTEGLKKNYEKLVNDQKNGLAVSQDALDTAALSVMYADEELALLGAQLTDQAQQLVFLQQANQENAEIDEHLAEQLRRQQNLNKAAGGFTKVLQGVDGVLNKLGLGGLSKAMGIEEAIKDAKDYAYQLTNGGKDGLSAVGKMKVAFKGLGSAIKVALGPMALFGMLVSLFQKAKKNAEEGTQYMAQLTDSQKNFTADLGVSVSVGKKLYGEVNNIGRAMGMTREQSTGAAKEIYGSLGGVEKLSASTMQTFLKLSVHGGVAADTLKEMHTFAKMTGQEAGQVAQNVAKTAQEQIKGLKLNVSMKQIMKDVAGVTSNVKIQFGGSAEAITKAVTKAKKLGLEMKDVEGIASSLLNIEDSLAAEMEAELLTGKELNLEKARAAALNGDNVGLMEALAEQGITQADYADMNVIQQEALAKSLGMSRDQMSGMLVAQKENTAENTDMVDMQKQGIEAMTAMSSIADRLANQEEDRLAKLAETVEENMKFEESMKNLQAAIQPILDTLLIPMLDIFTKIVNKITETIQYFTEGKGQLDAWGVALTAIAGTIVAIRVGQVAYNTAKKIGNAYDKTAELLAKGKLALQNSMLASMVKEGAQLIKNGAIAAGQFLKTVGMAVFKVISSLASIPVVGWGLGIAAAATVGAMAYKYMNDGIQGPVSGGSGYSRTMYGPEGAISFNDKDTIVAGTNLGGGGGGGETVAELQRISGLLNQLLNKEGGVYIDGNKVGATIALTNYQQQ